MSADHLERGGHPGEQDIDTSKLPKLPTGAAPGSVDVVTETPDLPCPKCGSQRTEMVWCDAVTGYMRVHKGWTELFNEAKRQGRLPPMPPSLGSYRDGAGHSHTCFGPPREHFHRGCLRCEYRWITEDVVAT